MGVTSIRLNTEIELPLEELAQKLDRSKKSNRCKTHCKRISYR